MDKPIIAITMGDADGIGPEIIVKVLSQAATYERCRPFVVGDPRVMEAISKVVGANLSFKTIERLSEASFSPAVVEVMCPKGAHIDRVEWGRLDPAMGKAAALCLEEAFDLAESGQIQGLVSAPLNKQAFRMAGYDYLDELAYMAERTGSPEPYIVGRTDEVWTIAVMGHVPFRDIVDLIKRERVLRYIESLNGMLKRVGVGKPKIAVAALNVHGGEGGLLGPEESEEIGPAIADARAESIDAQGPFPADTIFLTAIEQASTQWFRCITIRPTSRASCWPDEREQLSTWACRWCGARRLMAQPSIRPARA